MTLRLYYGDSYLREFPAEVIEQRIQGGRRIAVLDRTAFYPASGGQPHDTGTLDSARVLNVEEDESGAILHMLDSELPDGPATGRIDWERRFDHMQQHTGQHILSQAFIMTARAPTLSFHLGQETSTIDIDLAQPAASRMRESEDLACRIVFENRPVHTLTVDRAGLAALGVRKESTREGEIRVIDVEGFDRSACGGTHVRRTGEIGLIALIGYERYKGGTRVEFVCGQRALKTLRKDHEVLGILGRLYSGHPYELPRLAEKLLEERSALSRENSRLQAQVLDMEASELIARAGTHSGRAIIQGRFADRTLESVKLLAQKIAAYPGAVAILAAGQGTAQVVVARNRDVPWDCGAAVKETVARFGGRGGGRPELAQAGGIPAASFDDWFRHIVNLVAGVPNATDD